MTHSREQCSLASSTRMRAISSRDRHLLDSSRGKHVHEFRPHRRVTLTSALVLLTQVTSCVHTRTSVETPQFHCHCATCRVYVVWILVRSFVGSLCMHARTTYTDCFRSIVPLAAITPLLVGLRPSLAQTAPSVLPLLPSRRLARLRSSSAPAMASSSGALR